VRTEDRDPLFWARSERFFEQIACTADMAEKVRESNGRTTRAVRQNNPRPRREGSWSTPAPCALDAPEVLANEEAGKQ
jgi:hypothetical protein